MTPQAFTETRAKAITAYNDGKRSHWTILGSGTIAAGKLGAVKIRDQYGAVGLVAQQYEGAKAGMTLCPVPDDYIEERAQ